MYISCEFWSRRIGLWTSKYARRKYSSLVEVVVVPNFDVFFGRNADKKARGTAINGTGVTSARDTYLQLHSYR